jgi:hypothetical protein
MMSPNEAVPRTSSAMPGALGSVEMIDRLGAPKARSTNTTLASFASARASEIAA